ncbi:hypothetical protein Bca101_074592 [Brassica carinata]
MWSAPPLAGRRQIVHRLRWSKVLVSDFHVRANVGDHGRSVSGCGDGDPRWILRGIGYLGFVNVLLRVGLCSKLLVI